ncbi:MAG: cation:proton antiporter [Pirellulaceae bacterium]
MLEPLFTETHAAVSLGILLVASLMGGIVADFLRIPKVTAYLLAGVVVGPSVLNAINAEHIHLLEPLTKLAMALVLLELGCRFPLAHLRPILRRALWLSAGELLATFMIVGFAVWIYSGSLAAATILAALALATAPATTVLVLKEANSEGPVTELAGVLVALNNVAAIIVFEVVFLAASVLSAEQSLPFLPQIGQLFADLGGACLLGVAGGVLVSYSGGLLSRSRWLVMILAVSILMLGLCESWHLPYMLAFLVAGTTVVNTSELTQELLSEKEKITGLLVVVFFAVHGAELQLKAFAAAGLMGVVYIFSRSAGKILGIRWASRLRGEAAMVRRYLGSCMLAQAGAAIALATLAAERWPGLGEQLQVIILGSVVVFEILGPISIRASVLRAGEVPLAQAISHRTETATSQASKMWMRGREALGIHPKQLPDIKTMSVSTLLRRNISGLPQTTEFDDVLNYIRRSHDNTYVVTNDQEQVVGLIRYDSLSDTFFDASIDTLVRAEDLASPAEYLLAVNEPLSVAVELFRKTSDDILPVIVSHEDRIFAGVIRRSDLTELAMRFRK